MADVAEVQLIAVRDFTVGADTYKGIKTARVSKTGARSIGIRQEGELTPSAREQVPSNDVPVRLTIESSGPNTLSLVGTVADTCTFTCRQAGTAEAAPRITVTVVNPSFTQIDGGANNDTVQGFSIQADATDVTYA